VTARDGEREWASLLAVFVADGGARLASFHR
jgi:hypothetical protein